MSQKNKIIYKIITAITLALPLMIYMFLSATVFNVNPDIIVKNADVSDLIINGDFIYTNNENVVYNGSVAVYEGEYGFFVDEDTIIRADDGYFTYELEEISVAQLRQETSYKLPMAFIITVIGVGIVIMVVNRKMEWYKDWPRIFVLVSLITGALILTLLNVIVSNLTTVFYIASASWALYCVEYYFKEGIISDEDKNKADSDLLKKLKEALND